LIGFLTMWAVFFVGIFWKLCYTTALYATLSEIQADPSLPADQAPHPSAMLLIPWSSPSSPRFSFCFASGGRLRQEQPVDLHQEPVSLLWPPLRLLLYPHWSRGVIGFMIGRSIPMAKDRLAEWSARTRALPWLLGGGVLSVRVLPPDAWGSSLLDRLVLLFAATLAAASTSSSTHLQAMAPLASAGLLAGPQLTSRWDPASGRAIGARKSEISHDRIAAPSSQPGPSPALLPIQLGQRSQAIAAIGTASERRSHPCRRKGWQPKRTSLVCRPARPEALCSGSQTGSIRSTFGQPLAARRAWPPSTTQRPPLGAGSGCPSDPRPVLPTCPRRCWGSSPHSVRPLRAHRAKLSAAGQRPRACSPDHRHGRSLRTQPASAQWSRLRAWATRAT